MDRNRWIQLGAVLVSVGGIIGSSVLTPSISQQRDDLQLVFTPDLGQDAPAHMQLATSALGSFRGLAVNVMWYRLEMYKREGQFYEANTLSQWITTLQPRFGQVWSFMAWNMAYNISVQTHTPQERWDWVSKGINLLREQGIPYNPHAIRLYRELGWIFFHKVGQFSDDQHWYYKRRLAEEWHQLLGAPAEGGTSQQMVDAFARIADAYDAYVNQERPTRATLDQFEQVIAAYPQEAQTLRELIQLPLRRFEQRLSRLAAQYASSQPGLHRQLQAVLEQVRAQIARAGRDPVGLYLEQHPEAAPTVEAVRRLGQNFNRELLGRLGWLQMMLGSPDATVFGLSQEHLRDAVDQSLWQLLGDSAHGPHLRSLLNILRAQALRQQYNMDPNFMLELMEMFGPIDWRNSAAHSCYWSSLGVRMASQVISRKDVDLLNTDRQVIHSLQTLMHQGRIAFDPVSGYIDLLPDPRFVQAYEKAVLAASDRLAQDGWGEGTGESFESGYENFLLRSVLFIYLYGEPDLAAEYYTKLRDRFGRREHNLRTGRYLKPLQQLVLDELMQDVTQMSVARQFMDAMLSKGVREGLANNRPDVYLNHRRLALAMHERFQARAVANPTAEQDRMRLPAFSVIEQESYMGVMRLAGNPLMERARIWRNTPLPLRQAVYDRLWPTLQQQVQQHNEAAGAQFALDATRAFPAPSGMTEYRQQAQPPGRDRAPEGGDVRIERQ